MHMYTAAHVLYILFAATPAAPPPAERCITQPHSAPLSLGMACSYDWGYVCVLLFTVIHLPACAAAARSIRLLLLLQCYWVLWQPNQCTESPRVMPYVHDKMVMHHHVHVTHHFALSRSALVGAS